MTEANLQLGRQRRTRFRRRAASCAARRRAVDLLGRQAWPLPRRRHRLHGRLAWIDGIVHEPPGDADRSPLRPSQASGAGVFIAPPRLRNQSRRRSRRLGSPPRHSVGGRGRESAIGRHLHRASCSEAPPDAGVSHGPGSFFHQPFRSARRFFPSRLAAPARSRRTRLAHRSFDVPRGQHGHVVYGARLRPIVQTEPKGWGLVTTIVTFLIARGATRRLRPDRAGGRRRRSSGCRSSSSFPPPRENVRDVSSSGRVCSRCSAQLAYNPAGPALRPAEGPAWGVLPFHRGIHESPPALASDTGRGSACAITSAIGRVSPPLVSCLLMRIPVYGSYVPRVLRRRCSLTSSKGHGPRCSCRSRLVANPPGLNDETRVSGVPGPLPTRRQAGRRQPLGLAILPSNDRRLATRANVLARGQLLGAGSIGRSPAAQYCTPRSFVALVTYAAPERRRCYPSAPEDP